MVFGGVHEISDENRLLFSFDHFGNPNILVENSDPASPRTARRLMSKVFSNMSLSKFSDMGKTKPRYTISKKFFLESEIERKFYNEEFDVKTEREKHSYRDSCKQLEEMKKSLLEFNIFKHEGHFFKCLAEEKFIDQPEKKTPGDDSDLEIMKQTYLKESVRPISREGHMVFILKDIFVVVGGMRLTLALNDIHFIPNAAFKVIPMKVTSQLSKDLSPPELR